jgi:hypothetical protein
MILATHAIIGAAAAKVFYPNTAVASIIAFLSHFIFDAIPHWDYKLSSLLKKEQNSSIDNDMVLGKGFVLDIFKISLDFFGGIILSFILLNPSENQQSIVLIGALSGMLPDALQFLYWKTKIEPFKTIQKFHGFFHSKKKLKTKFIWGILFQATIVVVIVFGLKFFETYL